MLGLWACIAFRAIRHAGRERDLLRLNNTACLGGKYVGARVKDKLRWMASTEKGLLDICSYHCSSKLEHNM